MFIKWSKALLELEETIPKIETFLDSKNCLNQFESIEENIRDECSPKLYLQMWKIAFNIGKLSLANSYAQKSINYLFLHKRIPQIKTLIISLQEAGLLKNKTDKYVEIVEILLGRNKKDILDLEYFDYFVNHPEYWKKSSTFFKQFILVEDDWGQEQWKLCYEFILLNYFDQDIFKILYYKSCEISNDKYQNKFLELFNKHNVKFKKIKKKESVNKTTEKKEKFTINYDQIAMDLLSGDKEPNYEEQRRVMNSLKFVTDEELSVKGLEMIVAFELLGMEHVVILLCEKMINILIDVKQRASTFYVWTQALLNLTEYHKVIDLVDDVLYSEDVYGEERLAFLYVKAEAYFKLNKIKTAKEIYTLIQQEQPGYRSVGERLKIVETT